MAIIHEARRARRVLLIASALLVGIGLALWYFSPLADLARPGRLAGWLADLRQMPWAPLAVAGVYLVAGLIEFPVVLLIAATALVFDPGTAFVVSLVGALTSSLVFYFIGARFARSTMHAALGSAIERVRGAIARGGILAIVVLRSIPFAPFSVVNLAAGSLGVPVRDYLVGTALGLLPGILLMTAFGDRLRAVWKDPEPGSVALLLGILVAWIATIVIVQRAASRMGAWQASRATSSSSGAPESVAGKRGRT